MKNKFTAIALLAAALAAVPLAPANASGWGHRDDGLIFGIGAGVAAIGGAAIALATLPFNVVADIAAPPAPAPIYVGPVYAAPGAAYYGYGPAYYPHRQFVSYGGYPHPYAYPHSGYQNYGYAHYAYR